MSFVTLMTNRLKKAVSHSAGMAVISWALKVLAWFSVPSTVLSSPDPLTTILSSGPKPARFHWTRTAWRRAGLLTAFDINSESAESVALQRALLLAVARVPDEPELQAAFTQLFVTSNDPRSHAVIAAVLQRFDRNPVIVRIQIRQIIREQGVNSGRDAALKLAENASPELLYSLAEAMHDCGESDAANHLWAQSGVAHDESAKLRFALSLLERGFIRRGLDIISDLPESLVDNTTIKTFQNILSRNESCQAEYLPSCIFDKAFNRIADTPETVSATTKSIVLVNASLGAGGAERQCVNTAIAISKRCPWIDIEVWVRSLDGPPSHNFLLPELIKANIVVRAIDRMSNDGTALETIISKSDLKDLALLVPVFDNSARKMFNGIREKGPDIVHLWQDASAALFGLPVLWAGVPKIVVSFRSMPPPDKKKERPWMKPLLSGLLSQNRVTYFTNTRAAKVRYADWLSIPPEGFGYIPNGLSLKEGAKPSKTSATKMMSALRSIGNPKSLILGVMRLDENKRPDLWVKIAAHVVKDNHKVGFVLIGSGPLKNEMRRMVKELNLEKNVLIYGSSRDIPRWLNAADILLHTASIEGLPNAIIEAQAAEVPVVALQAGGVEEAFIPDQSGILIPHASQPDALAIAGHIQRLIDDPTGMKAMGHVGRKFVTDSFTLEKMTEATLDAYEFSITPPTE